MNVKINHMANIRAIIFRVFACAILAGAILWHGACTADRTEPGLIQSGYSPLIGLVVTKTDVGVAVDDYHGRIVPGDGWNTRWLSSVPVGGFIVFDVQGRQITYRVTLRDIEGKEYAALTEKDERLPSLLIALKTERGGAGK